MELKILDKDRNIIKVLDSFKSLVWTDRYCEYGDFELYVETNSNALEYCKEDYYVVNPYSEHVMIIENISKDDSRNLGDLIKISGRSLESLLERRIVYQGVANSNNKMDTLIKGLLDTTMISPSNSNRKVDFLKYENSGLDLDRTGGWYDLDPTLYEVITTILNESRDTNKLQGALAPLDDYVYTLGFKITMNTNKEFVFKLYHGKALWSSMTPMSEFSSRGKINKPYYEPGYFLDINPVIFSYDYDNIVDFEYVRNNENYKDVAIVKGNWVDIVQTNGQYETKDHYEYYEISDTWWYEDKYDTIYKGLDRREFISNQTSINSLAENTQVPAHIDKNAWLQQLKEAAALDFPDYKSESETSAEIVPYGQFQINKDFFLGDFITLQSDISGATIAHISEITTSYDDSGFRIFPSFEIIPKDQLIPMYHPNK